MESPTFELSRDLEALKLVPCEERRLEHSETGTDVLSEGTGASLVPGPAVAVIAEQQQLNTFRGLTVLNAEEDRTTSNFILSPQSPSIIATPSESAIGTVPHSCQQPRPQLLFSHLEHSTCTYDEATVDGATCSSCGCGRWNGAILECSASAGSGDVCPLCGGGRVTNQNSNEDIIPSFNSLSVSNPGNSFTNSLRVLPSTGTAATGSHMSCRQQAASYGGGAMCFDDTTVDDLAGYLDEIMFLPKPMSEMAELMYT